MNAPLLCLVLASLLLAPALSEDVVPHDFWRFYYQHSNWYTYEGLNCTAEMNQKHQNSYIMSKITLPLGSPCSSSNIIILGDTWDITPAMDVINICQGQGTSAGGDLFTSNKSFRVAKCQLQNQGAAPPNCIYKAKITTSQITVTCKQRYPVHLEGSE